METVGRRRWLYRYNWQIILLGREQAYSEIVFRVLSSQYIGHVVQAKKKICFESLMERETQNS